MIALIDQGETGMIVSLAAYAHALEMTQIEAAKRNPLLCFSSILSKCDYHN